MYCFYNSYDETLFHIFYECDRVKCLWSELVQCFQNSLILPTLTPQIAIFLIFDSTSNDSKQEIGLTISKKTIAFTKK